MLGFFKRNGIALAALFVALAGTAYAVGAITGRDVKDDSLTGRDINESKLRSTRLVAQPRGDDNVIAPPLPQSSPPPQPPSDFGVVYPVSPDKFRLRTRALVEVIGHLTAVLQSPCEEGSASAFVFVDGKHLGLARADVPGLVGAPIPNAVQFAPLRLGRGVHTVEVRVASLCEQPAVPEGGAAEIRAVRLGVIAHQF